MSLFLLAAQGKCMIDIFVHQIDRNTPPEFGPSFGPSGPKR